MPAIYPAFEKSLPAAENFDGRSLSGGLEELDSIANSLHIVTLSELIDARTMALEVLDEDQLPANCPPVRWYSAQEGLTIIQGLLSYFEQRDEDRAAIVADLQNLSKLLEEAKSQHIRFHLLVDT
jgi:hypothetical protein